MRKVVEVPKLHSGVLELERRVNGAIRSINTLSNQISEQQEKLDRMIKDKNEFPRYEEICGRVCNTYSEQIDEYEAKIEAIKNERDRTKFFRFVKRIKLKRAMSMLELSLDEVNARLMKTKTRLAEKRAYISSIDETIENGVKPNMRAHLGKLVSALREYRLCNDALVEISGVNLPTIKSEDIIQPNPANPEFPYLIEEQDIYEIKFEQEWDDWDEMEEETSEKE